MAQSHEISMPSAIWTDLVAELARRGSGVRESGAFLLGSIYSGRREVMAFIPYDELEPGCLDAGYINFTSIGYRKLWRLLKECGLQVVGDIHTHPGKPIQSHIDRDNPMMPNVGHIALILANYAQKHPMPSDAALYIFKGSQLWESYKPGQSKQKFYVGFWS
ncbi:MAG: hypothetical protein VKJ04_05275 [Vampirovibrionales bacterium]|nr:hypothetical protein [Vampirovibrionales bacterium]